MRKLCDDSGAWCRSKCATGVCKKVSKCEDWDDCRESWSCRAAPEPTMQAMPQSNKEKQEAFRARNAMLGMTEVRGIYLPPELHTELKRLARELLESSQRTPNRPAGL